MTQIRRLFLLSLFSLWGWQMPLASAQTVKPVVLTATQTQYPLGLHLELLEDPTTQLTIDDVTSADYATQFTPSQQTIPNFGYTDSAIWARVRFLNTTESQTDWRLGLKFPNMQHISLFHPKPDGTGFEARHTGTLHPFATRDVPYHRFVFRLSLRPGRQQTIYLRVQSEATMRLEFTLWSPDAFTVKSQNCSAGPCMTYSPNPRPIFF